jgi:hypothetical protein
MGEMRVEKVPKTLDFVGKIFNRDPSHKWSGFYYSSLSCNCHLLDGLYGILLNDALKRRFLLVVVFWAGALNFLKDHTHFIFLLFNSSIFLRIFSPRHWTGFWFDAPRAGAGKSDRTVQL